MGAMHDETMPGKAHRVFRYWNNLPALIFGILIIPFAFYHARKYDRIIITTPPESLLILAYLLQKVRSGVVVDIRDRVDRKTKNNKWQKFGALWTWLLRRITHRVAIYDFFQNYDKIISHGYMDLDVTNTKWTFVPEKRMSYEQFRQSLSRGLIPDYRPRSKNYAASTFITLRKYFDNLPAENVESEARDCPLYSYREIAKQWRAFLTHLA